MAVKVHVKNLHISARKVRLVADLVRGMEVPEASQQLQLSPKGAARPLLKLLKAGIATATNDFDMLEDNLRLAEILVNEGPTMKRWRPRAHGRAFPIMKRASHVTIVLKEIVKGKKAKGQKKSASAKKPADKKAAPTSDKSAKDDKDQQSTDSKPPTNKGPQSGSKNAKKGKETGQAGLLNKMFRRKSV